LRAAAKDYSADPQSAPEWKFRLKDKSGDQSDGYLLEAEIAGLLARVDDYVADSKIPRYRPNTVDQPLLSPLNSMVAFGIQGANKGELAPPIAAALGSAELKGIFVITVSPGSLAESAGVKAGDDLCAANAGSGGGRGRRNGGAHQGDAQRGAGVDGRAVLDFRHNCPTRPQSNPWPSAGLFIFLSVRAWRSMSNCSGIVYIYRTWIPVRSISGGDLTYRFWH